MRFHARVVSISLLLAVLITPAAASPTIIYSVTDLQNINNDLSGNYVLGGNIDATGVAFSPIGESLGFTGTLNGAGYSITGLTINSSQPFVGLFGPIADTGVVENLNLTGVSVVATGDGFLAGALAGLNAGLITNSSASGNVSGSDFITGANAVGGLVGGNAGQVLLSTSSADVNGGSGNYVGGLVGTDAGVISHSASFGSVVGGNNSQIGGLTGAVNTPQNGSIVEQSYSSSDVSGGANSRIGGLVAWNYDSTITQSYATGAVTGAQSAFIGGLVGENGPVSPGSYIDQSYSTGSVLDPSGQHVGGLVGQNDPFSQFFFGAGLVNNSYWDTQSSGQPAGIGSGVDSGATGQTTAQLKSGSLPAGFDSTVWTGAPGQYPTLQGLQPTVINTLADLQAIQNNLSGHYVLGGNIDASATALWNGGAGFNPIGNPAAPFTGTLDGGGFTISNLTINRPNSNDVGLFGVTGATALINNLNITNGHVTAYDTMGLLVGQNGGTIASVNVQGTVTGSLIESGGPTSGNTGGLVGYNTGVVENSNAAVNVASGQGVGGLIGTNYGTVVHSQATGNVSAAQDGVGGLVGGNAGTITRSDATGNVHGKVFGVGGLAGSNSNNGTIDSSYATGTVTGDYENTGGLVGELVDGQIVNSYARGAVIGNGFVGGLVGKSDAGQITTSYSTGAVSGNSAVGGLIGSSSSTNTNDYWDINSSNQAGSGGGTPRTTSDFQSGLPPTGFDPAIWTTAPGNYPTLQWQNNSTQLTIPQPYVLAALSNAAYASSSGNVTAPNGLQLLSGPRYTILGANTPDGFGVATFQSQSDPSLIVIAVRGTDPSSSSNFDLNVVADNSFASGVANDVLQREVLDLIRIVADVHSDFPGAQIMLTGHSLGGALAQIVGSAIGLGVTSFDAPGAGGLFDPGGTGLANNGLKSLADLHIQSPTTQIVNYRLHGDQVSLVDLSKQLGTTITVSQIVPDTQVDSSSLAVNWDLYHSLQTLAARLGDLCGSEFATASCAVESSGALGRSIVGSVVVPEGTVITTVVGASSLGAQVGSDLWSGVTQVGQTYGALWNQTINTYSNWAVSAGQILPWDPPPGFAYLFQIGAGSPNIESIQLADADPVFGWELQYLDQFGWSEPITNFSSDPFQFNTDVTGLLFFPLDAGGSPIFDPNSFYMGVSFASDGQVNATLTTFGPPEVPEPMSLPLFGAGLAGAIALRRRNRQAA